MVDCAALEMPCTVTRTEGSNPSLSALGVMGADSYDALVKTLQHDWRAERQQWDRRQNANKNSVTLRHDLTAETRLIVTVPNLLESRLQRHCQR